LEIKVFGGKNGGTKGGFVTFGQDKKGEKHQSKQPVFKKNGQKVIKKS
jgi:hypothetical protein